MQPTPGASPSAIPSLATSSVGIQTVRFDDGTVWTRAMFEQLASRNIATPGDDRVTGTTGADDIAGG